MNLGFMVRPNDELWRRLGKSYDLYVYFQLWLIMVESWYYIEACVVLGLIGWYDVELKYLDYCEVD